MTAEIIKGKELENPVTENGQTDDSTDKSPKPQPWPGTIKKAEKLLAQGVPFEELPERLKIPNRGGT